MSRGLDWGIAPRWLIGQPASVVGVYLFLDLEAGRRGHCAPTQSDIAAAVGVRRQTVNEAIAALVELDVISVDPSGRRRRYFIHQRGEWAAARAAQLPLDVSAQPDRSPAGRVTSTGQVEGADVSARADSSRADVSGQPDSSRIGTSFRIREEDDQPQERSSSSSVPDLTRARGRTAECPKHEGVEGLESLYTRGQFRHPLNDGDDVCTFIVEAEREPAAAAVNRAGSWEDVERLRAWREANA